MCFPNAPNSRPRCAPERPENAGFGSKSRRFGKCTQSWRPAIAERAAIRACKFPSRPRENGESANMNKHIHRRYAEAGLPANRRMRRGGVGGGCASLLPFGSLAKQRRSKQIEPLLPVRTAADTFGQLSAPDREITPAGANRFSARPKNGIETQSRMRPYADGWKGMGKRALSSANLTNHPFTQPERRLKHAERRRTQPA